MSLFCQICDNTAQGTHFGAQTCRACAAFFRRAIVGGLKYKCRNGNKQCRIEKDIIYCKFCRYSKCIRLGMVPDNVQWNRDSLASTIKETRNRQRFNDKRLIPGWRKLEKTPILFDLTNVLSRIEWEFDKAFEEPNDACYRESNALTRMHLALKKQNFGGNGRITINNEISFQKIVEENKELMKEGAEWMMHSEEFRTLGTPEKVRLFMETWQVWEAIYKMEQASKFFGKRVVSEKIFMVTLTEACLIDRICIDFSAITAKSSQEIKEMMYPVFEKTFENVIKPYLELEPSSMETTFILCNAAFSITSKKFSESILSVSERFLERISNDLHEYYIYKKEIHYAARLLKLVAIVNSLRKVHLERKKLVELAELFDVFPPNACEPNFFR